MENSEKQKIKEAGYRVKSFGAWTVATILLATMNSWGTAQRTPPWAQWYGQGMEELPEARRTFYIDSRSGNDTNDGMSSSNAWKTLDRIHETTLQPGDHILLKKGSCFKGVLCFQKVSGSKEAFIHVDAYGEGKLPVINGSGHIAAVHIEDSRYIGLRNLEIINDNSEPKPVKKILPKHILSREERKKVGKAAKKYKHKEESRGVWITTSATGHTSDIHLRRLFIHDIFPATAHFSEGKTMFTHYGYGIEALLPKEAKGSIKNIAIDTCRIERTGHFGIRTRSEAKGFRVQNVVVCNTRTEQTGGSGLIVGWANNVLVSNNVFNHSGAFVDERMHGRGSGSWTFAAENVLYEKNHFMNALGLGDSAGVHIDYNCRNVIVQRNLSYNNEGGFMEVLGNNYNCAYRYNISINDGARIKDVSGALQEGKTLFVSGHCMNAPYGPFNSYFYNNTIYVKNGINPKFAITHSADGLMIVNNIFYLLTDARKVEGDQPTAKKYKKRPGVEPTNVVFRNNIYTRGSTLPSDLMVNDSEKIIADPKYRRPGGTEPKDYIPRNRSAVKDKGLPHENLPGDEIGLEGGVAVNRDFFGNPIVGLPDMGAIEIQ